MTIYLKLENLHSSAKNLQPNLYQFKNNNNGNSKQTKKETTTATKTKKKIYK